MDRRKILDGEKKKGKILGGKEVSSASPGPLRHEGLAIFRSKMWTPRLPVLQQAEVNRISTESFGRGPFFLLHSHNSPRSLSALTQSPMCRVRCET